MEYFLSFNGQTIGPMTREQVFAYPVSPATLVCTTDDHTWTPLFNHPELMEMYSAHTSASGPAYAPGGPQPSLYTSASGKDHIVAGVLAILLGGFGAQYFYVGKAAAGLITILLSFVTCGIWPVLMLVQGIVMLTMTPQQFDDKYVYNPALYPIF